MSTRRSHRHTPRKRIPEINRYGSMQAHHALLKRAAKAGIDFLDIRYLGRCTGIKQIGCRIFLTIDMGVGCTRSRVVKGVRPLDARQYVPHQAHA